jgi:cytochrome c551/c552/glucose/arabinose dehydrogenase
MNSIKTPVKMKNILTLILLLCVQITLLAQNQPTEDNYYKIVNIPAPEGLVLEAGGVVYMPNGSLAVSTRRGDVYIIDNPTSGNPQYKKFATGLHEILGLAYKNGSLYCAQRGELTKLVDDNNDGIAELYQTIASWPLSGHYHEYSFGPVVGPDGAFYVTGNVSFGTVRWWEGKSYYPGRGWTMRITEDGTIEQYAAGMRSPCGIGLVNNEFFYGDNQGDWMGSGFVTHVEKGDFTGHPASLNWAESSFVKARQALIFKNVDPRDKPEKPEYIKDEPSLTLYEMAKKYPEAQIKSPAVWLPHGILGVSTSEILQNNTGSNFGPFEGQLFVGDQGMSKIARVSLEKVKGVYQGAAFDFRSGFKSGVLRMAWGEAGTMYVGGTNRGWSSAGREPFGIERLIYTENMPFEMKSVSARPDGFEITFTQKVDKATAENVKNYEASSYIYKYHPVYGSPTIRNMDLPILGAKASADGLSVRLVIGGLREGYVHQLTAEGVRSDTEKMPLLHDKAYYTLNVLPDGPKADFPLVKVTAKPKANTTKPDPGTVVNTPDNQKKEAAPSDTPAKAKVVTEASAKVKSAIISTAEATKLLNKYTCSACHKANARMVGPAFKEVAKRKYTDSKIVSLIYNPQPDNWPDYTPMAPMSNVPKADALKIAAWINSLK